MKALREQWEQMQERERRIALIGGVAAALLLLYALLWEPLDDKLAQMESSVAAQRATLAWIEQAAAEARALRGAQGANTGGRSLLVLSEESARQHHLSAAIKRIAPEGQHTVRVWLEDAAFDELMRWLDTLSYRHGSRIVECVVDYSGAAQGKINARVTLEAPI